MPVPPDVLNAAEAYLVEVVGALEASGPAEEGLSMPAWTRRDGGYFHEVQRTEPEWSGRLRAARDVVESLPAGGELEATARAAGVPLDQEVGTVLGVSLMDAETVAAGLRWRYLELAGMQVDCDVMRAGAHDWFVDLVAESESFVWVAPILGLEMYEPIKLGEGLELARLNDDEIAWCLKMGLRVGPSVGARFVGDLAGIRLTCALDRVASPFWGDDFEAMHAINRTISDSAEKLVAALRVWKTGGIACPLAVGYGEGWSMSGFCRGGPVSDSHVYPIGPPIQLGEHDTEAFLSRWNDLERHAAHSVLAAAIHRFSLACSRPDPRDRLVDLTIACESLFLSDTGSVQERGELKYRLALRACTFVEVEGLTRRQLFDRVGRAYNIRSRIVHGEASPTDTANDPVTEQTVPLHEFVASIEEVVRCALRKAVGLPTLPRRAIVEDWDELVVGPKTTAPQP